MCLWIGLCIYSSSCHIPPRRKTHSRTLSRLAACRCLQFVNNRDEMNNITITIIVSQNRRTTSSHLLCLFLIPLTRSANCVNFLTNFGIIYRKFLKHFWILLQLEMKYIDNFPYSLKILKYLYLYHILSLS